MAKLGWKCDYCDEVFKREDFALNHENLCNYNPKAKKCGTCKNLKCNYGRWECSLRSNKTYKCWDEELTCPEHRLSKKQKGKS